MKSVNSSPDKSKVLVEKCKVNGFPDIIFFLSIVIFQIKGPTRRNKL